MSKKAKMIIALLCAMVMLVGVLAGCDSKGGSGGGESGDSGENTTQDAPAAGGEVAVTEWNIPVLSAITGPIAYVGKPASWAAEYAVRQINNAGGIRGVKLTVKIMDTKFDTSEVAALLSGVIDNNLVVVGPMDAPGGEVAGQMISDSKVANIAAYSYEDSRKAYAPYAIAYMTDSEEGDYLAAKKWLELNPDIKSVAIFLTPSDASQVAAAKLIEKACEEMGVEVKGQVEVETDTMDCGPAAVKAINLGAEGFFLGLRADEAAKLASELRARGVDEGRRICATFACFSDNYFNVAGAEALDGSYIWQKMDPNYDGEEWNALVEAYKADFDGAAPTGSPVPDFYNALIAIKQCFEELEITGDPAKFEAEKEAIANWLYNSPVIHGIQGDFHWENGKKISDVYFFQLEGNKPVAVK